MDPRSPTKEALAITLVHVGTGYTFKAPWLPEMQCGVYLKEYIAGEMWKADPAALKMHIKTRQGVDKKNEDVTVHVHVYSPEDPLATPVFSFLNRKKKLREVMGAGAKLYYDDNKLSFGVIEGNIWMGGDTDDNDGVTCCECGKGGSSYATNCLHRFHWQCIDDSMARRGLAGCPKCGKGLSHNEMMRLALTKASMDGEACSHLQPAKY
jgi:hypothetical protein